MPVATQKLERQTIPGTLVGVPEIMVKLDPNENPFFVLDETNTLTSGIRTLGAGLTNPTVVSDDIKWRKLGLQLTTNGTTNQTITWAAQLDLSSGFFNSVDDPRFVVGFKSVSNITAFSQAQRTVNFSFVDTAGTPITFKAAAGANTVQVPELDYILTNAVDPVTNVVTEVISLPLKALVASATKIFTVTMTFNLPTAQSFILHKVGAYKNQWDSILLGFPDIRMTAPKSIQNSTEGGTKYVKGQLGQTIAVKAGARDFSLDYETEVYNYRHGQILSGASMSLGGKYPLAVQNYTIPSAGPFEISSINKLTDTQNSGDVFVSIQQADGSYREAIMVEGGNFLPSGTVRYVREGSKKLQFSSSDAGKKVQVIVYAIDADSVEETQTAIENLVKGTVYVIIADAADYSQSKFKILDSYSNVIIKADMITPDIGAEEVVRMKMSMKSLTTDLNRVARTRVYKA